MSYNKNHTYTTSNSVSEIVELTVKALNSPAEEYLCDWPSNTNVRNTIAGLMALRLMKDEGSTIAYKGAKADACVHGNTCTRVIAFSFMKKFGLFGNIRDSICGCLHIHAHEDVLAISAEIDSISQRNGEFHSSALKAIQNLRAFKDKYSEEMVQNGHRYQVFDIKTNEFRQGFVPNIDMHYIFRTERRTPIAAPAARSTVKEEVQQPVSKAKQAGVVIMKTQSPTQTTGKRAWAPQAELEANNTEVEIKRLETEEQMLRREIDALKRKQELERKRTEQQQIIEELKKERELLRAEMGSPKTKKTDGEDLINESE